MKTIVIYYSRKGSNEFLAKKIAGRLSSDIEPIRPRINAFGLILMNLNPGIRSLKHRIEEYDRIILVGPIFMGRFISPLRSFLSKYRHKIENLVFVTCCGSTYEHKDDKFGHGLVFNKVKEMMDGRLSLTQAFPVGLILPEDQREDSDAFMKAHLNDSTFQGEIAERFEEFMTKVV
jgi:flavodoxin